MRYSQLLSAWQADQLSPCHWKHSQHTLQHGTAIAMHHKSQAAQKLGAISSQSVASTSHSIPPATSKGSLSSLFHADNVSMRQARSSLGFLYPVMKHMHGRPCDHCSEAICWLKSVFWANALRKLIYGSHLTRLGRSSSI